MKITIVFLICLIFAGSTQAFDASWINQNVHDRCVLMESKVFFIDREDWSFEADSYGEEIGATNGLVDTQKKLANGSEYKISFYKCPENCVKNPASDENGLIGKEKILSLIGAEQIDCRANLVVSQMIEFDFDGDGYNGYALRYKTVFGGNQGSRGHLTWGIAFIKNTHGMLSTVDLKFPVFDSDISESYVRSIKVSANKLGVDYLTIDIHQIPKHIEIIYGYNGKMLVPVN